MQNQPRLKADLEKLLHHERDTLLELQSTLELERKALLDQDSEAIISIAQVKHKLLDVLEESSKHSAFLHKQHGYGKTGNALNQLLDVCGPSTELSALSNQVNSLSNQCRELNISNGLHIRKSEQYVRSAIQILRGEEIKQAELYNSAGTTGTGNTSRSLGEA